MKTFKKLFAYSAIFALLATMMPTYANAASYDAELTEAYAYAKNKWITTMTSIDNADMYGNLTRVAMAKMVANYVLDLGLQELDTDKECNFPDVSASLDEAYDNGVTKACQLGLMGVGIEKFNPNGIVTRAEFGTVLSRALWGDEYNGADPYYKDHLQALKDEGIMNIIDNPNMKEVRGYVMLMMMRADDAYTPTTGCSAEELLACIIADDYETCIAACSEDAEEEVVLPGFVTVKGTAAGTQEVPYNTLNVKVGTVTLKAGENDTKISSVEISRNGLYDSANSEVSVALRNANIETEYFTISKTTDKVKVKFSPALVLKANTSETFDVVLDLQLNNAKNDTHNLKVTDVIVSNGTSAGCPISLWTIKTTSAAAKTITASLENWDGTVKAWETWKKLAVVKVDFSSAAWVLNRITLWTSITGTPTADLDELFDNLEVYVDGNKAGTASIDDWKVILSDLNISKEKYETAKVELKGDVISTKATNTVTFDKTKVTVDASESTYGFGMRVTAPTSNATVTVNWYNLTFKKATLENKTVLPGKNNVLVFDSVINSSTDVIINELTITKATSSTSLADTDLKDDGVRLIVNWDEFIYNTLALWNKVVKVNVDAWKEARIQIYVNTKDTANGKDIRYNVKMKEIKGVEKNAADFSSAVAAVNGDKVSFEAAWATVAAATESAPATRSLFASKEQEMWRFSIKADGDKLTVNWFTLVVDHNTTDVANYVDSNLTLVDVATDEPIVATFAAIDWSNKIVVSDMNYSIDKDATANIKVMINMPSIDASDFGKYMKLSVELDSLKAIANGNDITTNPETALSTENYTLRITAPEVKLAKQSDNMFKLTIKNMDDNNDGVEFNDIAFRVRTTASDNKFDGKVCIVDDVNTITCDSISTNNFGKVVKYTNETAWTSAICKKSAWTSADPATDSIVACGDSPLANATAVTAADQIYIDTAAVPAARNNFKLSKNGEKVLYILIEGDSIEPDVLKADISSLSYDKFDSDLTDTLTAEKYNVSKLLNE